MSETIALRGVRVASIKHKLVGPAEAKMPVIEVTLQCRRTIQEPSDMQMLAECMEQGPAYRVEINKIQIDLDLPEGVQVDMPVGRTKKSKMTGTVH